jgi:putative two-component system response regulator
VKSVEQDGGADILVVDSDFLVLTRLNEMLEAHDLDADLAGSVGEARDKLSSGPYGCVVVDRRLRDGSGLDLLAEIKDRDTAVQVIVITAFANMESAIESLRLGAFDYITKPFENYEAIVHRIAKGVEQWRMKKEMERLVADLYGTNERLIVSEANTRAACRETLMRLALAAEYRDSETSRHLQRMAQYSRKLAETLGASPEYRENLFDASPLHDIGKIGIPDAILRKPGKLTPAEWDVMKTHTLIGAKILEGAEAEVLVLAREVAVAHHERWDGTGYPYGLAGSAIPLAGRIVAVADVFDALTSKRCYKPAYGLDDSLEVMRRARGSHFDPSVIDALAERLKEFEEIYLAHREQDIVIAPVPEDIRT